MRHLILAAMVCLTTTTLCIGQPAQAEPVASPVRLNFTQALALVAGSITIPPEWDGVWSITDSLYDCAGSPQGFSAELDTLCAGQEINPDPDAMFLVSCSGVANATTVDVTCSGTMEVFPFCTNTLELRIIATRTGETYFATSVTNSTYAGTGLGCDLLDDSCEQVNTHGTRLSPAPSVYCATPVLPSTWGRVKTMYR